MQVFIGEIGIQIGPHPRFELLFGAGRGGNSQCRSVEGITQLVAIQECSTVIHGQPGKGQQRHQRQGKDHTDRATLLHRSASGFRRQSKITFLTTNHGQLHWAHDIHGP